MAAAMLKRASMMTSSATRTLLATRNFASVAVGSDLVSAAPNVSLQKARTWDEGVSSNFSTTPIKDIFKGKKVVIFGLPGAFTGVCSAKHVPSYKDNIQKFKTKGVDSVICVSVNDPYVMNGWAEKLQAKEATSVLKVNIHCDGCQRKVKKILQKIDGVYKINIDSEQGKVTVSGNVGPDTLIQKLTKNGKYAELWCAPKTNNNNQSPSLVDQLKDLKIDKVAKGGMQHNNKGQGKKGGVGGGNIHLPKGGGAINILPPQLQNQMKPPQINVPKGGQNQKSVKFDLEKDNEEDDYSGDDYEDDNFDDGLDDAPLNKMKTHVDMGIKGGGGGGQMPNVMKNDAQMASILKNHQSMLMNGVNGGGGDKSGKIGGNVPVQIAKGGGSGGKKGGNGGNPNQSGGGGNKGGKKGGGQPHGSKNGGDGGGGQKKNSNSGGASMMNVVGPQKGGHINAGMPNMIPAMNAGGVGTGQLKGNIPMDPMGQFPPVQGLPAGAAAAINSGSGGVGGVYYQGAGPEAMTNPYYQQQMAAMMMNQQRAAAGDERFEARPPGFNYVAPYHPYGPYAPPSYSDPYSSYPSDENNPGCNVM